MGGGIHAGGEGLPKGVMSITDRTTDATDLSVAFTIYGVDGMRERHFDGNRAGSAPAPFAGCTLCWAADHELFCQNITNV
jgi:hypothetical protein